MKDPWIIERIKRLLGLGAKLPREKVRCDHCKKLLTKLKSGALYKHKCLNEHGQTKNEAFMESLEGR